MAGIGSTITAAISPPSRANSSRSAASSSSGSTRVSPANGRRHAGRRRAAEGREPGARGDQQVIGVAVVAAGELDDQVAPGGAARQADGAHHRLGAGGDAAHLLEPGIGGDHRLGELDLGGAGRAVGRAARAPPRRSRRAPRGARGRGSAAPRSRRSRGSARPSTSSISAPSARAHEERRAADRAKGAHRRVDAAGEDTLSALEPGPRERSGAQLAPDVPITPRRPPRATRRAVVELLGLGAELGERVAVAGGEEALAPPTMPCSAARPRSPSVGRWAKRRARVSAQRSTASRAAPSSGDALAWRAGARPLRARSRGSAG